MDIMNVFDETRHYDDDEQPEDALQHAFTFDQMEQPISPHFNQGGQGVQGQGGNQRSARKAVYKSGNELA